MATQDMLKQGTLCRVGSGASINIMSDPWLPSTENPYIVTKNAALENKTVSSLMVIGENQWDVDLIYDMFDARDANLILSIPLNHAEADHRYWKKEKLRFYLVKSAYVAIQENKAMQNTIVSHRVWRRMWNLKVPPKVKHLVWRAATECFPTKVQLRQKKMNVNPLCPMCNNEPESIHHVLLQCTFAASCWQQLGISDRSDQYVSFVAWLSNEFDNWDTDKRNMGAMICWAIWRCRNELVWNQRGMKVIDVVESAKVVLNQWRCAQDNTFDHYLGLMNPIDGDEHWVCPTGDMIKVNSDAAIFEAFNCFSYAFVVRDSTGRLVEARSKCCPGEVNPEAVEAIGIREALSWIKEQNREAVTVETDCIVVVQAIRSDCPLLSYFGRIIQDCKSLMTELKDRRVTIKFVKRSANHVTHYLASYSSSIADRIWRVRDVHPEFSHVLANDLIY